jgi:hypothetical protein
MLFQSFLGEANLLHSVGTPAPAGPGGEERFPNMTTLVHLHREAELPGSSDWLTVIHSSAESQHRFFTQFRRPAESRHVVIGFELDGVFILGDIRSERLANFAAAHGLQPEHSSNREPVRGLQLIDPTNSYAVGTKRVLVILGCPSNSPDCFAQAGPFGFCDGLIRSQYGCSEAGVTTYMNALLGGMSSFYERESW